MTQYRIISLRETQIDQPRVEKSSPQKNLIHAKIYTITFFNGLDKLSRTLVYV